MKKQLPLIFLLALLTIGNANVWSQTSDQPLPQAMVANGTVSATLHDPNTNLLYIGGDFTELAYNLPYGSGIDQSTGTPDLSFAKPNEAVWAAIPDGNGGWYIGGGFTQIAGEARKGIAHITSSGQLGALFSNMGFNGNLYSLALDGSTLYAGGNFTSCGNFKAYGTTLNNTSGQVVGNLPEPNGVVNVSIPDGTGGWYIGGSFTQIAGESRNRVAHINAAGELTPWNPNANGTVRALAVLGSTVYAGGDFTSIGGQTRNRIAALDAGTGLATAWNPNANGTVYALALSGSTVYAGGSFTIIGGQTRNRIAALDAGTGLATTWNPDADGLVYALALSGSTVYAGGTFTIIGGQNRSRIAALDVSSGNATTWDPNASSTVFAIAISGSTVYAGGFFTTIGGQTRNRIAALDAGTGLATAWNPNGNNTVYAITLSGSTVYAGGTFTSIGGQNRSHIAALDASTGSATTWDPNASNRVNAIAISGSTVYAGGEFATIGGQTRNNIAAIDVSTGLATVWNPNANNIVRALAVSGSTVYAGGDFTTIGGQNRSRIAALDASTGLATSWYGGANNIVRTLALSGSTVYAGGDFTIIGGQTRNRIAALDVTSGLATTWNPYANSYVYAIAVSGSTVYAGGDFTSIGGLIRNRIAALDASTGLATPWNSNANSRVWTLAVSGNTVYAGGYFTNIGGQTRNRIAGLDISTGNATTWDPNANGYVYALAISGSTVYAGGGFTTIGGQTRNRIAALDASTGLITSWNPNANSTVYGLAVSGSTVYAGGQFTNIGGQARNRLAALDAGTGLATAWNPNTNNTVRALAVSGSTVYAGGDFTSIGGQTRNRIAALDASTGAATSWNPNANSTVYTLALSSSTVYAGGDFTSIGGQTRNFIAALDAGTGLATAWNPNANNTVYALVVSGSTVYAGGFFTSIGGQTRNRIAAIDAGTGSVMAWNPNANNVVFTLAVSGSTVYAGGSFGTIGGVSQRYLAIFPGLNPVLSASYNSNLVYNNGTPQAINGTDFGKPASGGSVVRTFTLTNTGTGSIDLNGSPAVSISGSTDFTISSQPASTTLSSGASTTFDVTFTPSSSGPKTATISIANNTDVNPFAFEIQGTTNTALDFDGSNDFVVSGSVGSLPTGNAERSVEFWVKTTQTSIGNIVAWGRRTSTQRSSFAVRDGKAAFIGEFRDIKGTISINDGIWHHVAITYDGGNVAGWKIYVDGTLDPGPYVTDFLGTLNTTDQNIYLGRTPAPSSVEFFDGTIDEVRIWSHVLCQAEIQDRMNSSLQGNEYGLVAYYDFEEGVPGGTNTGVSQVLDKAGISHGTLTNFAKTSSTSNWVNGNSLTDDGLITGTDITWLGTTDGNWDVAANWDLNRVPSECDNVIIPPGSNQPTLSGSAAINSLDINAGETFTVAPGACLRVSSTANNEGTFILQANSSGYAQYFGPSVTATMQQVMGEAGWHTIASPFIDATLADITFDQNAFLQFGSANLCNIQYYDGGEYQATPPGSWTTAWGSWVCASGSNDAFDGSRAYNLFLDGYFVDAFPVTMEVTGTLRNAPITHSLNGANGGWNNLSNPFPSVIDWEKWSDNSDVLNTYYVWDASANGGLGDYLTYQTGGVSVPANAVTRYIAPYQSVFVKTTNGATSNPGSDEVDNFQGHPTSNADRPTVCPGSINEFFKNELTGNLYLQTNVVGTDITDDIALRFAPHYQAGYNNSEEAVKFFSPNEADAEFYTLVENQACVISAFPNPDFEVQHIPLGMQTASTEEIRISATEIPEGMTVFLEDKQAGTFHNLQTPYTFKAAAKVDNTRFKLHIGDNNLSPDQLGASENYLVYQNLDELVFVYNEKLFGGQAQLLNVSGQILARTEVCEGCTMNVSELPVGLYIVMIEANGKTYRQKIVVK